MNVTAWEQSWPNLHEILQADWLHEQHLKKERERIYYTYSVYVIGNHVDKETPGYFKKVEVVDEFGWVAYSEKWIPKIRYLYDPKYLNIPKEEKIILDEYTIRARTAKAAYWRYADSKSHLRGMSKNEVDAWCMKENYPYG